MRDVKKRAFLAALILLVVAHLAYWYAPREHAGAPKPGTEVGAVLNGSDLPLRVWLAYPHQNLAFAGGSKRGNNWRRGLAGLLDLPEIKVPAFGPFSLPPASELALATDESGERMVVAARIYPGIAAVARAAGAVAGNPWLAGGTVVQGGRRLEVAWSGRIWMLRTEGERWPEAQTPGPGVEPALLRVETAVQVGPVPPGAYRVLRNGRHLDLLSAAVGPTETAKPEGGLLLMTDRREPGTRGMAVLGPGAGSLRGIPSALSFSQAPAELPELPFERLYKLLGIERRTVQRGGWAIVASDKVALERGLELQASLRRALPPSGSLRLSADLDVVRAASGELERQFEGIQVPAFRELRRWQGAELILTELGAYDGWTLEINEQGTQLCSRLWRAD